uniref:Pentatricopeptide repeat-containing protein n=1 Tax=Ananas comosus var. bracteatus TaxID=296719 RepID=A0A6V7P6U0_ANACO|nr:unnamed protein product [Ananas comosus var. bracteatus]
MGITIPSRLILANKETTLPLYMDIEFGPLFQQSDQNTLIHFSLSSFCFFRSFFFLFASSPTPCPPPRLLPPPPPPGPLSLLLLDSLCDRRLVVDAESLFLRLPSPLLPSPFPPDTKVYNLLLRSWLKVHRWRRCRELWLDMDRNRVPKDLHSYSVYMDALSKSGKPWNAVRLFKEMSRKFAPDAVAYNTAIHALGSLSTPACPPAVVAGEALVAGSAVAARGRVSGRAAATREFSLRVRTERGPLGMRLRTRSRAASGEWEPGEGARRGRTS